MGILQEFVRQRFAQRAAVEERAATEKFMKDLPGLIQQISTQVTGAPTAPATTGAPQQAIQEALREAGPATAPATGAAQAAAKRTAQPKQPQGIPETPPIDLPEPSLTRPMQQPERFAQPDVQVIEESVPIKQPPRFHKPMKVSGISVNPRTRSFNINVKPDQAAMDAQFGTAYKDYLDKARASGTADLSMAEMRDNLFWNLVGEFGFFPSDQLAKQLLPEWEDRQEQAYTRIAEGLRRQEDFRTEVRGKAEALGLSEDVMERFIKFNAYTAASQTMNGYMPEGIREGFAAMRLPSLKPETEEVLAERGVSPMLAGGEQIGAAREQIRTEEVQQAAAIKGAQIGTEYAMRPIETITGKDRAKHGVGVGFTTYTDIANAGMRFPTQVERKDYLDLSDVTNMIDSVNQLVESVFSSSDNYASRVAHGVQIRASMAAGGELGLDAKEYDRQLGVMGRKMLSLVERGGRFTNQDMEQILKTLPKLNLLAPDGKELAKRLIERARVIASKKLESYRSVLIKPTGQPGAAQPAPEPSASPQAGDWIVDEKGDLKKVK